MRVLSLGGPLPISLYTYRLIGNSPPHHLPGAYPLSVDVQGTPCSHCALHIPQGQSGRLSYPQGGQCVGVHGLLRRTTGPLQAARPTLHPWQDCAPAHLPKLHRACTPVMPPCCPTPSPDPLYTSDMWLGVPWDVLQTHYPPLASHCDAPSLPLFSWRERPMVRSLLQFC